jgi:hypothetical protein
MRSMKKLLTAVLWLFPLALHSADAHAWGLFTHVYFAQLLVWAVPLADPRLRRLAREMRNLVMAGACLPDLAIVAPRAFAANHRWETATRLLDESRDEREQALALGFASHLLADVIAHNHFVPAHESLWADIPLATHLACEWAMDAHVAPHLFATPTRLLRGEEDVIARFVGERFGLDDANARQSLQALARADALLRGSRLPELAYRAARRLDGRLERRFNHFAVQTAERMGQLNRLLEGAEPVLHPETACRKTARAQVERHGRRRVRLRLPLPAEIFRETSLFAGKPAPTAY